MLPIRLIPTIILDTRYHTKTFLASNEALKGASLIGIQDSAAKYTGVTVETALAEIAAGTTLDDRYVNVTGDTMTGLLNLVAGTTASAPIKFATGVNTTTPVAGTLEYDGCRLMLTNIATRKAIDRTSDVAVATVTVANTADETTLWTGTMPANSLCAGNVFKVHCDGIVTNDSGFSGDEVTLRIYVGASVTPIATLETNTRQLTDQDWHMNANATQRTIGASGQRAFHVHLEVGDATARGDITALVGIATIDTTANMDIKITAEWASADANNTISLYQGYMSYKN